MDDGTPALEVGFVIDTGGSFENLVQLQSVMGSAEAKIVAEAATIERATSGMVNLGGAKAGIRSFGNAYSLEAQNIVRASARIEKAGERLVSQLERENAAFGKSRSELRQMKAEEAALAAERVGNSDLARRIREQETDLYGRELAVARQAAIGRANAAEEAAAAEVRAIAMVNAQLLEQNRLEAALQRTTRTDRPRATDAGATYSALAARAAEQEAAAATSAAAATAQLAREHDQLAAAVRGSHAAQEADAAAAERLRMATDPLYAATSRLNAEIAESTRLYYAGATAPAEYARQQQILTGRLQEVERQHASVNRGLGSVGEGGKLAGHHVQNLAFQFQDLGVQMAMAAGSSAPFRMAMMALFQQGTQISGIMSQAGIGAGGLAKQVGAMVAPFAGAAAVAALLGTALLGVKQAAASDAEMQKFAAGLGLTRKEMKQLDDVSVTWGDTFGGVLDTLLDRMGITTASMKDWFREAFTSVGEFGKFSVGIIVGAFYAGFRGIARIVLGLPGIVGEAMVGTVNLMIAGIEKLINGAADGVNYLTRRINEEFGTSIGEVATLKLDRMSNKFSGTAKGVAQAIGKDMHDGFDATMGFFDDSSAAASKRAFDRVRKQAKGIIDDRTPKTPRKPREDHSGESLAREIAATEALIKNNYDLAAAYQVSDAAAFEAEIRAKATSEAIKKKANVEAYVVQQMRLAVSQRAVDGGKAIAEMTAQTAAQRQVNDAVSAGTMTSEAAQAALRNEAQLRPLLVAQSVAEGDAKKVLAGVISRLRGEQAAANVEAARAKVLADTASTTDQLERLQVEASLINASNKERAVTLAQLEVEQYLRANLGIPPDEAAIYRQTKVAVATMSAELAVARSEADLLLASMTAIADQASVTAGIMSSAFGDVGNVIGGVMEGFAGYRVQQQQLAKEVAAKTKTQAEADKILATLQTKNTAMAISGVKSLFKEKSTAFKVMSAVEKAFAAWQAAETIASMVRDATKTTSAVINSGVRTTANTAEGGSKIFAELGPWAFPVVAAMVAVLAALGASAGGGGSSGPSMPSIDDVQAGQGTGSILGDSKAKSESITRSLDIVASNTNRDLEYSNAMLTALRSIDFGISKMAGTIARQISVSGSMFDTSKLGLGTSGSSGFLGIGAKSTTKSLYDLGLTLNSGSVADILANGISGTTYQVVEKIKKKSGFLGIGGGTKTSYSTTTGAIDSEITDAIVGVISGLRSGILSAADVVGLEGAQAILDSFTVSVGKISLTGLSGTEIEEQLNAIFSKVGDDMAGAVFPALSQLQMVGEGLFETFTRVAREYQVVDIALESIGKTFGSVGVGSIAARDELVQLFGSLDDFANATSAFRDAFLTDAEQIAPIAASVRAEMERLGLAGVTTRDQFKQAVLGLDLTTAAGREMYASLLAVAPAFDKVLDYFDQASKATADGLKSTADQFYGFVKSLTKYRDSLFAVEPAQGNGYQALRDKFTSIAALAATGDASALEGLEGAGKAFLDAARNNASTREQYMRDVAMVARGVDAGIFAADATADYAKLQLDAMSNAVSILGTISTNTAATAIALGGSSMVSAAGASVAAATPSTAGAASDDLREAIIEVREELAQLRADNNAGHAATAGNTGRMARKLEDVTAASGGDAITFAQPV